MFHDIANNFMEAKDHSASIRFPVKWGLISGEIITALKRAEDISEKTYDYRYDHSKFSMWYQCSKCDEGGFSYVKAIDHLLDK